MGAREPRRTQGVRLIAGGTLALLILTACGGDPEETAATNPPEGTTTEEQGEEEQEESTEATEGDGASGDYESISVAWSSEAAAYVPQSQGPWRLGPDYGLMQDEADIDELASHSTAVQLLLSGRAEVATGSFTAFVQTVLQGQDIKAFCPIQGDLTDDFVGVGDLDSLEEITEPQYSVAVDSPGGLINHVLNHVFASRDLGITVADLENVQILEDGGLRLAALASGEADAAVLDPFEKAELVAQRGEDDVHTLSTVAEDMETVGFVYAATGEWLEENQERAAAFCASVLAANRQLAEDFDTYVSWSNDAVEPDPDPEVLQTNWDRAREYAVWPYNDDLMQEDIVLTDLELAVQSAMVEEEALDLGYEDLVDPRPAAMAVELLGGPIDPADVTE